MLKEVLDYGTGTILLVVTTPVLVLIAAAIKLDSPGPVFFAQRRYGLNRRIIKVIKFRTMTVIEDGNDVKQVLPGDNRVTRVGRFLRKTGLDELPQLINVLRGEMSVIGPRPHVVIEMDMYQNTVNGYADRLKVKPGITGWAQVNGCHGNPGTSSKMQSYVDYDLFYIENQSLQLDMKILFMTIWVFLSLCKDFFRS